MKAALWSSPDQPGGGGQRAAHGSHHPGDHWLGPLTAADGRVLDRAVGPVLDVGCGPARHAVALAERRVPTLGIDITPALLDLARPRGAVVLQRDVFDRVPGEGRWGTVLLLDGNLGIGGDLDALLARVHALLRPGGSVLGELTETSGGPSGTDQVRVEVPGSVGPWFGWAVVGPAELEAAVARSSLELVEVWEDEERTFAELRRDGTRVGETGPP